jgi:sulfite reductase (NADPH) flavoprotein alpha-component
MSSPADSSVYSKDHPFLAKISENRLLNKPGSAKETRHFVVDMRGSGLHYKAGDSLGVFPSNRSSEVDEILQRLGATGKEPVSPAALKLAEPITLREALTDRRGRGDLGESGRFRRQGETRRSAWA